VRNLIAIALVAMSCLGPVGHANAAGPDPEDISLTVETLEYTLSDGVLSVPKYADNAEPGAPRLPVYGAVVKLPPTGEWRLSYESSGDLTLQAVSPLLAIPVPQTSAPAATPWTKQEDVSSAVPVVDRPDPAIYEVDAFYPAEPVVAGEEQWQRGRRLLAVRVYPFQYNAVRGELLYHPTVRVRVEIESSSVAGRAAPSPALQTGAPVVVDGELGAVTVRTKERGMHRIGYEQLQAHTLPVNTLDPRTFTMTNRGQRLAIEVAGESDGKFEPGDEIVFYAEPYEGRWMSQNVYRLAFGTAPAGPDDRIATRTPVVDGSETLVRTISQTIRVERDKAYYSDYDLPMETDHFFDDAIGVNSTSDVVRSYDLALDDPVTTAGQVRVEALLYGGTSQGATPDQSLQIRLNATPLGLFQWDGRAGYAGVTTGPAAALLPSGNQLHLVGNLAQLTGITQYYVYPDWVNVTYPAVADAEGDRIYIESLQSTDNAVEIAVTGFTMGQVRIFDVRDPGRPIELLTTRADWLDPGYELHFWDTTAAGSPAASYYLTTHGGLYEPVSLATDTPSLWRVPQAVPYDYIAIVHSSLAAAAQPLLDRRAAQGYSVATVDVQDIYDEFNHGLLHPQAIRDFLAYAYREWNGAAEPPAYVLLVGDGHYDFKGVTGTTLKNLIPPYLVNVDPWIIETASDNRYVSVDGPIDFLPEMAIGRIPAQTPQDVTAVVNKIAAYEDAVYSDELWQNRIVFAADPSNNAAGNFHGLSDATRLNWLPDYYDDQTVYYGSSPVLDTRAEVYQAIKNHFNAGALYLQWFGHASRFMWSNDYVWSIFDGQSLNANTRLPFTLGFSCWEGYFINLYGNYQTLGETQLLQAGRGSIAHLGPSGKHVGDALVILDQGITKALFQDRIVTMGDAVDSAKLFYFANSTAYRDVIDTSVFFGDPALKLRLPLPPPEPPVVGISAQAGSAGFSVKWDHLAANTSYEVWRGVTPYFVPGQSGLQVGSVSSATGFEPGQEMQYMDDGTTVAPPVVTVGDPLINYTWVVRGANWRGLSGSSNRVGEFDFVLVPGE
jgi:hypothetical protein